VSLDESIIATLVDAGTLSGDQVSRAHETANEKGIPVSEALVQWQMVDPNELSKTTA